MKFGRRRKLGGCFAFSRKGTHKVETNKRGDEFVNAEEHSEGREIFYSVDEGPYDVDESDKLKVNSIAGREERHNTEETLVYDSEDTESTLNSESDELMLKDNNRMKEPKPVIKDIKRDSPAFRKVDALPDIEQWGANPVWIRMDTMTRLERKQWRTDGGSESRLEYNEPVRENVIHFETDLFKGKAVIRFRNCPNEPAAYFKGRRRKQQWTVQGQFKKRVPTYQVVTGYEFKRKVVNIPARWIVRSGLKVVRTLAPTMKENIFSDAPYFLNPMLQTVQALDVSYPGNEPDITKNEIEENNSLLGGKFSKHYVSRGNRKHYFASLTNGKKFDFDPSLVYTFDFYEDKFDPSSFKLVLPFMSFDICKYLDSQPISMIGKVWDEDSELNGSYLFNFSVFHKSQIASRKLKMKEPQV